MYMDMGMGMGGGVGVWRMVGRGRKEKDLMVGQISFYVFCCCVVRMDGFVQNRINEFVQRQVWCRCPVPPIRFCTRSSTHILSHREASASAQKAWSSAGRRGPRFGVGAGVCLGWSAARDVACVWAPWGVLGEGKARGWAAAWL